MRILRGIRLAAGGGPRRALLATVAFAVMAGTGVLAASPASADESSFQSLTSTSSWYSLDVQGDSTSIGASIDVWYANGDSNQNFTFPGADGEVGQIENQNSQMCITTDGVAGDTLYQFPCVGAASQQWEAETWSTWYASGDTLVTYLNPASGLVMEIYGDSYSPGALVDAWYPDNGLNQSWQIPGCSQSVLC